MKRVVYDRDAARALRRLPGNLRERIRAKIQQYARDPASLMGNVKKLRGSEACRLRVGNWRVIFDDDGTDITVRDIGPRGGVYDR